ncbi:MAG: hypothetical protein P8J77_06175 [Flavobacteriales bacterium]|jgi:hypothetical protein|nr:hypothetical protein [Flavobacteriales bacterium]
MLRRLILFGFGALISIFFLSLGPENRLKTTFYAYVDYFSLDKRVINHLYSDSTSFSLKSECQLVYFDLTKLKLLTVLDGGEVNFSKSEKNREPCQLYLIENKIEDKDFEVLFEYCYTEQSVSVLNINVLDEDSVCSD